jgi:hypothetical protein
MATLSTLMASPEHALKLFERVDIAFHGYDTVQWEIFEIPEVRAYVNRLDEQFPYGLF